MRPEDRRTSAATRWWTVAGLLALVALVAAGALSRSGPATEAFARTETVVLVSIPGLQWGDLDGTETPALDRLLQARGVLSVRTASSTTTDIDGYLTLGAGNRLSIHADLDELTPSAEGTCVAPSTMSAARQAAEDQSGGAEPGALGEALRRAGRTTAAYGSRAAILGLARGDGCVDAYAPLAEAAADAGPGAVDLRGTDVSLVELGGLADGASAAVRAAAVAEIDAQIAALDIPEGAAVIVVAPSAPGGASEVTIAAVRAGAADAVLSSGTTRRAPFVTIADVAPTVLALLGADVPSSMSGTEIRWSRAQVGDRDDAVLADLADRIAFRDRAVGPLATIFVVFIALTGFAAIGRRGRLARTLAAITAAYPTVTFLSGLVDVHRLPLDFVVVATPAVAMAVASVATASWSSWGRWAPVSALIALLWLVLVVDVATGGTLQINTVLGYTPTIAGRFQGFGNLASALVSASALAVALVPLLRLDPGEPSDVSPRVAPPGARRWMAWVALVTLVAIGAPAFGSDVGGTLTFVPAIVVVALIVTGRRVSWRKLVLAGVAAVALVAALAAADLARPADARTHLGRFADDVVHGEAWMTLRRKLRGNLAVLTSTFWTWILLALFVVAGLLVWRHRARLGELTRGRLALRAFPVGVATMGVVGFAVNDSGIAIPAVMLGVGIPWIASVVFAPARRAGR